MKVATPAMKLDVRIDSVQSQDGQLVMNGMAGMLPCKTILTPAEFRQLVRMALRPSVVKLLFKR